MKAIGPAAILVVALLTTPTFVDAQWAYLTPPWNFDKHPKYAGKPIQAIPLGEWEQLAAFDSAQHCERARLFARDIRGLSAHDRERLVALFAAGAEEQARQEAKPSLAYDAALRKALPDKALIQKADESALAWWSASKCVPLRR